ncbi:MAG: pyruvate kinase [Legionellales bacterium]|nr:pyruvate kinase [Legionellales bacterium]|tara:strand:- start:3140 stop:4567 length:1428 start_codon:yes stop_codon:yes gene_type:complete
MTERRRTKIIATLGPATDKPDVLKHMIDAGVDLVRMNFSHGSAADHQARAQAVRAISQELDKEVGILADLQGPKIRIAKFKQSPVVLAVGDVFTLDGDLDVDAGDNHQVGIDYKDLPQDVAVGDILLLDDGRLEFQVKQCQGNRIICDVLVGGELSNNKGINRKGGGLSAAALTDKDKADLITAVELGADYIAISFPRSAEDVEQAKQLISDAKGTAGVIAKIERSEAVVAIDEIIKASDGIMVARGDLGVEIGDAELPSVQKSIIQKCRALDKAVITATQMMETMIHNSIPTRAEVFDVANAVLDGTDAVMLSAETAAGVHPDKVIEAMSRICLGAERNRITQVSGHRVECQFERVDEAIAMATMYTANHLNIRAILSLTESGSTPLWMSRIRSGIPIYGLSRHDTSRRKMTLYRGVYPINFDVTNVERIQVNQAAIDELLKRGLVESGDLVIITKGDYMGVDGGTNAMKIVRC